ARGQAGREASPTLAIINAQSVKGAQKTRCPREAVTRLTVCRFEGRAGWSGAGLRHRRRAVAESISFVGLDVRKATIAVAVAEEGRHGEVRFLGEVPNDVAALDRLATKLGGGGRSLRFCYEAGPCGYGVHRHLSSRGHDCIVVAPSQIPRGPGDR